MSRWRSASQLPIGAGRAVPTIRVLGLALSVLVGTWAGAAYATLPAPPFDFTLSATRLREGTPVTVRIAPRGRTSQGEAGEQYDIYLMRAFTQHALFLTPAGSWSYQPTPYLAGVSPSDFTAVTREWANAGPGGLVALAMVIVRTSTDPLIRLNWVFEPRLQWLTVTPPARPGVNRWRALALLIPPGLLSVAASLLVLLYPVSWRRQSSEGRQSESPAQDPQF